VNGYVRVALYHGSFNFAREQTLAADRRKRTGISIS
jgi:hypothetical protein